MERSGVKMPTPYQVIQCCFEAANVDPVRDPKEKVSNGVKTSDLQELVIFVTLSAVTKHNIAKNKVSDGQDRKDKSANSGQLQYRQYYRAGQRGCSPIRYQGGNRYAF